MAKRERLEQTKRIRRFLDWLVRLRGSPRAIAGGAAIGVVIAFTPTIGIQALLSLAIATLLNANRPVSIVPIWITNPVTIPPIYALTYYIGSRVWPGPDPAAVATALRQAAAELAQLDFFALRAQLDVFLDLGLDVFIAMWIGGLAVGGLGAAITYPLVLRTVEQLRARRARRRKRRGRRRKGR
jgi:uncharacterized protein (DUF2062 family)